MKATLGLLLAFCAATAQAFGGVVTHVTDGDTVWVQPDAVRAAHRKPVKVRLQGIDAPERCQAWGAQAQAALESRVLHQHVQVQTRAKDRYERTLGTLRLDGVDVSAWMVEQGHAWSDRYRHRLGPYAAEERQARTARRGLFADAGAIEPWRFRKAHGPCE